MSATELRELRDLLLKIREYGLAALRFFPDGISLGKGVRFSRDGYIHVRRGRRVVRYTVEKFFMHQARRLRREDVREALESLRDLLLLVKLREGTLRARDVLRCRNAAIRRFLLAHVGYERLVRELKCVVIHRDGESELIMVPCRRDEEPIVLVKVRDPSTGAFYLLRVPPSVRTCKEAIAWTFGLQPHEYNPLKET